MSLSTVLIVIAAVAVLALAIGYLYGRRAAPAAPGPATGGSEPASPRAEPRRPLPTAPPPPAAAGPVGAPRPASVPGGARHEASAPRANPPPAAAGSSAEGAAARPAPPRAPAAAPAQAPRRTAGEGGAGLLAGVRSWGYQLQKLDLKRAAASPFDLIVIDYALDGSDDTRLAPADLDRLKRKPDGSRRIVLAYLSIGEAESYRYYWDDRWKRAKPDWMLGENPEWKENYAVCFWDPGWQRLMCGAPDAYLDRIVAQGFDGVYLDKCDVTEDMRAHFKKVAAARPGMERDMVAFVQRLSTYAKAQAPGFLVVMQNAEALLDHADLVAAIDGVAKEELLYGLDGPERRNKPDEVAWSTGQLDKARGAGKAVLSVEYLNAQAKIEDATRRTSDLGYVLYVSDKSRELDRLNYETWVA